MIKSRPSFPCFLAAVSVLLCILSSANAQDKVLLRMNLQPGQSFDQGLNMQMKTSQTIHNKRMDVLTTTRFILHNEVIVVDDDGNTKLKLTYKSIALKSQSDFGDKPIPPQNYDSRNPSKNTPAALEPLAGLVGAHVISTMTPQGKVIKVEGMDVIILRMMSGIKDAGQRAAIKKMLNQTVSSAGKSTAGMLRFPQAAVAIGDSWTSVISGFAPIELSVKYTLMSSKDGVATLAVKSNLYPNPKAPALDMAKFKMKSDISGTLNGVMRVDEKTGLTIDSELHQRMKDEVLIATSKSTSASKQNPAMPSSMIVYMKGVMRSWTAKLPQ